MLVPIRDIARLVSPSFATKRFLLLLRFYCDESYLSDPTDGDSYRTFVVGGFLAQDRIWERLERRWQKCNDRFGVKRYHATHVNGFKGEFAWKKNGENDKVRQREYSKQLLNILADQGSRLCSVTSGIKGKDYCNVISDDGRKKWGNHYIVCFKQCVALIAQLMGNLSPDYKFSVILDRCAWEDEAVKVFYGMKDCTSWQDHDRLVSCTPGSSEEIIPLQSADLIAYETYKLFDSIEQGPKVRHALQLLLPKSNLINHSWDATRLQLAKSSVENANVGPNGYISLLHGKELQDEMFILG